VQRGTCLGIVVSKQVNWKYVERVLEFNPDSGKGEVTAGAFEAGAATGEKSPLRSKPRYSRFLRSFRACRYIRALREGSLLEMPLKDFATHAALQLNRHFHHRPRRGSRFEHRDGTLQSDCCAE
jgi:hypothetical protein